MGSTTANREELADIINYHLIVNFDKWDLAKYEATHKPSGLKIYIRRWEYIKVIYPFEIKFTLWQKWWIKENLNICKSSQAMHLLNKK